MARLNLQRPALLNTRVPQPHSYRERGVPPCVIAALDVLSQYRNKCAEEELESVDAAMLRLLEPWVSGGAK